MAMASPLTETLWASPTPQVKYRLMKRNNKWPRLASLWIESLINLKHFHLKALIALWVFVFNGCANRQFKSAEDKIEFYESRARYYRTLYNMQRLSPPYSEFSNTNLNSKFNNEHFRGVYSKNTYATVRWLRTRKVN